MGDTSKVRNDVCNTDNVETLKSNLAIMDCVQANRFPNEGFIPPQDSVNEALRRGSCRRFQV